MNIKLWSKETRGNLSEQEVSIIQEIIQEERRDNMMRQIIDFLESNIATTKLLNSNITQRLKYTVSKDTDGSYTIDVVVSYTDDDGNIIDQIEFDANTIPDAYKGALIVHAHTDYLIEEFLESARKKRIMVF